MDVLFQVHMWKMCVEMRQIVFVRLFFCVLLCVMHAAGCVFAKCVCSGVCVCLCVSGCEPSILLTPSGLCVGLFHQHYHLLVFYSGPRATMTTQPSRFAHQAHQIGSLT